ncbi:MAG: ATPase, T2SS/T4P/T4SS family [Phycisphaeraceae bacterium]
MRKQDLNNWLESIDVESLDEVGAARGDEGNGGLADLWQPEEPAAATADVADQLLNAGVINREAVTQARNLLKQAPGARMADVLVDMGVDEEKVQQIVAQLANVPFERVDPKDVDEKHLHRLGVDYCKVNGVVAIREAGARVVVGVTDPRRLFMLDEVRRKLNRSIKVVLVTAADVRAVVEAFTEEQVADVAVDDIIKDIQEDDLEVVEAADEDVDLEKQAGESPVIRFVNYLVYDAVKNGASDIHIEPQEKKLRIRYRIDGILFEMMSPPHAMHAAIVSRLKIMANLDISERRLPQDGRIRVVVHGRKLDLRLSTLPTGQGEKAVMRILDSRSVQVSLNDLGMPQDSLLMWEKQIAQPHGIILVTGPTGSGKTTTLYASLSQMDRNRLNISTVEDPIEYHLDGINQVQTYERIGMSFAAALRSLLRQDPDVVMVGEIRDEDTSRIAVQAALTGHLVLSTLHTNDAPSSITRLINIGVEPYLLGAAVNAVLAQRLVRRICEHCKKPVSLDDEMSEHLAMHGLTPSEVFTGEGCEKCHQTGYSGRLGLYEMLVLDDAVRDAITARPSVTEFRRLCIERGMTTLRVDGFQKVAEGRTTVEEVLRVTQATI